LFFIFTLFFASAAFAQDSKTAEPAQPDMQRPNSGHGDGRGGVLQRLGLTPDQIAQIRQLNVDRRPAMQEAQKHLREANRALDAAIYADQVNETDVDARLRDVSTAQAEVSRLRSMNELAIRRLLTPEQLAQFREMRQRFDQRRDMRGQRPFGGDRPMRRKSMGPGHDLPAPQQPDTVPTDK
jgi:Spy/CpxP family protein refolding chaperone